MPHDPEDPRTDEEFAAMIVDRAATYATVGKWRDLPPTQKQLDCLRRHNWIGGGSGVKTRGEAADRISKIAAKRFDDRYGYGDEPHLEDFGDR